MNDLISVASLRLGKTSVDAIKNLYESKSGVVSPFSISVVCTQVPQELNEGVYVIIWLGSDNNKGIPTSWKQGYKAFGCVKSIDRGSSYNDESTTLVDILYAFEESINRLDFLKESPEAYYDCSALPIIGLDDHSNQTIRMLQNNGERYDIGAMFYALNSMDPSFKVSLLSIDGKLKQLFNYIPPSKRVENLQKMRIESSDIHQLIYYGAPGTGKSFTIDQLTNESNSVRTTFHPDSDYAGFVGAYKPTMAPQPINAVVGTTVHHANDTTNKPAYENKIVYKYVPQAFLKAYVEAWKRYSENEDNPYYLVIEEINRGNCAQIFGDLFQLLDRNNTGSSSYAISADEDIAQFLREDESGFALKKTEDGKGLSKEQRDVIASFVLKKDNGTEEKIGESILDGSKLLLPPNMRIWATMNTSDQSLFPIDSAFKRRWNWEYLPIDTNPMDKKTRKPLNWKFEVGGKTYYWGKFLEIVNKEIEAITVSEDKQMGYFFAKPDKKSDNGLKGNDTISEKVFVNKVLFYLWTDVFRDYGLTKKPFIHEVTDKDGKPINKPLSFREFFPIPNNKSLADFMTNLAELGLDYIISEENTANTEEATKRAYGRKLVIEFPDGTQIKGDTQFDSYMQALEKIGLDAAAGAITKKGYSRNNAPLISKEKYESIEDSPTFSYVQSGEYFIIKGIDTMEGTLNGISKELGLGLTVGFE